MTNPPPPGFKFMNMAFTDVGAWTKFPTVQAYTPYLYNDDTGDRFFFARGLEPSAPNVMWAAAVVCPGNAYNPPCSKFIHFKFIKFSIIFFFS